MNCRLIVGTAMTAALLLFSPALSFAGPTITNPRFETVDNARHYIVTLYNSNRLGGRQSVKIYYKYEWAAKVPIEGGGDKRSCNEKDNMCFFGEFFLNDQESIDLTLFVVPEMVKWNGFAGSVSIKWIPSDNRNCGSCYISRRFDEPPRDPDLRR
jgi:hypothetical protein